MPFWSERSLQRIISRLVEKRLIVVTQYYNASKMDKSNWHAIGYEALSRLTERVDDDDKLTTSLPEIKQETTPERAALRKLHVQRRQAEQDSWLRRGKKA